MATAEGAWVCTSCTFMNAKPHGLACEICTAARNQDHGHRGKCNGCNAAAAFGQLIGVPVGWMMQPFPEVRKLPTVNHRGSGAG